MIKVIFLIILSTVIGNDKLDQSKFNDSWRLVKINQNGLVLNTKEVEILKFKANSVIESLGIDGEEYHSIDLYFNDESVIFLNSDTIGHLIFQDTNRLIIRRDLGEEVYDRIYIRIPKNKTRYSDLEVHKLINDNTWTTTIINRDDNNEKKWVLCKSEAKHSTDLNLVLKSSDEEIIFPAEIKRVKEFLFLTHIASSYRDEDLIERNSGIEYYNIMNVTKNELTVLFHEDEEVNSLIFKKEK